MADVESDVHTFSSYEPSFKAGSELDFGILSEPIPEPAVWMQLIAGFGLVGTMLRRRKAALA